MSDNHPIHPTDKNPLSDQVKRLWEQNSDDLSASMFEATWVDPDDGFSGTEASNKPIFRRRLHASSSAGKGTYIPHISADSSPESPTLVSSQDPSIFSSHENYQPMPPVSSEPSVESLYQPDPVPEPEISPHPAPSSSPEVEPTEEIPPPLSSYKSSKLPWIIGLLLLALLIFLLLNFFRGGEKTPSSEDNPTSSATSPAVVQEPGKEEPPKVEEPTKPIEPKVEEPTDPPSSNGSDVDDANARRLEVIRKCFEVVHKFLQAESIGERLKFCRHPEETESKMLSYYTAENPYRTYSDARVIKDSVFITSGNLAIVNVSGNQLPSNKIVLMETSTGDFKVDWESFVVWQEVSWEELSEIKPEGEPVIVRCEVGSSRLHGDSAVIFQLKHPTHSQRLTAFLPIRDGGSQPDAERALIEAGEGLFTLSLKAADPSKSFIAPLEIHEVKAPGWVVQD